jgi:hypothetical protein
MIGLMKILLHRVAWLAVSALGDSSALAQLGPNAPRDQLHAVADQQLAQLEKAMAPYVVSARQTYPAARSKFLDGLPPGEHPFLWLPAFSTRPAAGSRPSFVFRRSGMGLLPELFPRT